MTKPFLMTGKRRSPYYPVGSDCVLYHAYWDGTATDHSSYGNTGTVYGATFIIGSLQFDGANDWEEIPTVGWDDSVLSLEMWVRNNEDGVEGNNSMYQRGQYPNPRFVDGPITGVGWWPNFSAGGGTSDVSVREPVHNYLNCQAWKHVVWTYDSVSDNMLLYVNGVFLTLSLAGSGNPFSQGFTSATTFTLCGYRYNDNPYGFMQADVGEIRVWKTALSQANATSLFNATKARYGL